MSCCPCILLDEECLKKRGGISPNILFEDLRRPIEIAQELCLLPVLGDECLSELCAAKAAETLTYIQLELLGLIEPMLIEYALYYYKKHNLRWKPEQVKFVVEGSTVDERIAAVESEQQIAIQMAESKKAKVLKFLTENIDQFPCYALKCKCDSNSADLLLIYTWPND